jgi:hypothetical protein
LLLEAVLVLAAMTEAVVEAQGACLLAMLALP